MAHRSRIAANGGSLTLLCQFCQAPSDPVGGPGSVVSGGHIERCLYQAAVAPISDRVDRRYRSNGIQSRFSLIQTYQRVRPIEHLRATQPPMDRVCGRSTEVCVDRSCRILRSVNPHLSRLRSCDPILAHSSPKRHALAQTRPSDLVPNVHSFHSLAMHNSIVMYWRSNCSYEGAPAHRSPTPTSKL